MSTLEPGVLRIFLKSSLSRRHVKIKVSEGVQNHFTEKKQNVLLKLYLRRRIVAHFKWTQNANIHGKYDNRNYNIQ
jgi:hypothetical protein